MLSELWWPLSRASGIVAWLFLAAVVFWGILLASPLLQDQKRPAWLLDLHRWLGGLAVTFTTLHLGALWGDSYVEFDGADFLVPFASTWKPGAVAWGVVTLWGLAAVEVTSLLKARLSRRIWRFVHVLSYGLFWSATLHGAAAGTDASAWLYRTVALTSTLLLVGVTLYRVLTRRPNQPTQRAEPAPSTVLVGGEDHA